MEVGENWHVNAPWAQLVCSTKVPEDIFQTVLNLTNEIYGDPKHDSAGESLAGQIHEEYFITDENFSKSKNSNEIKEAERINDLLQPVHKALFIESNPSPVKYAAKLLNLCSDDVRLPLVKVMDSTKETIKKALMSAKLI